MCMLYSEHIVQSGSCCHCSMMTTTTMRLQPFSLHPIALHCNFIRVGFSYGEKISIIHFNLLDNKWNKYHEINSEIIRIRPWILSYHLKFVRIKWLNIAIRHTNFRNANDDLDVIAGMNEALLQLLFKQWWEPQSKKADEFDINWFGRMRLNSRFDAMTCVILSEALFVCWEAEHSIHNMNSTVFPLQCYAMQWKRVDACIRQTINKRCVPVKCEV